MRRGSGHQQQTGTAVDPASVRNEAEAAGFVLDGESAMLANKNDPHSIKAIAPGSLRFITVWARD
jgi:predicted methyltransferase